MPSLGSMRDTRSLEKMSAQLSLSATLSPAARAASGERGAVALACAAQRGEQIDAREAW